ncbi:hypothetical protein [Mycolicibacterium sp.]|uniref:DUF7832 domain-containing protein n=1 Tax=Mycolicibacterium sp. TaxID=2320850 RepID=UPI0037CAE14A
MTYDDAGWHYDTVSEHGLDYSCAATHIGMFFAWLAHHGLVNTAEVDIAPLLDRAATPGAFLLSHCCGEIDACMLTAQGASFCEAAYGPFMRMYDMIPEIARYPVIYAAPDTWSIYDAVAPVIDEAYAEFSTMRQ